MNRTHYSLSSTEQSAARLYRVIFASFLPRAIAGFIVLSFILQPLSRAEASEDTAVLADVATVVEALPTAVDTTTADPISAIASQQTATDSTEVVTETDDVTTLPDTEGSQSDVSTTTSTSSDSVEVVEAPSDSNGGGHDDTVAVNPVGGSVSDEYTDANSSTATTSSSTLDVTVPVSTVMSDSQIQFDKSDCVSVADGSFYCQPKKSAPTLTQNGFFALPDSDGDLEIFIQKDGQMTQLTHNTVDDAAPYYDAKSQTVVWHRLINDRYQIMSLDVETGVETQLTDDSVNNMEPNRAGDYTVWQHWNNDNWDVQFSDGNTIKTLSTSLEHDIAPSIRGTLVVWTRISADQTQTIELYDISSGEFTTITDSDGGVISNPRMVLVYESSFQNGDVVTKGYDLLTGEIAELATTPVSVPDKIPPADSTGETRALIQVKPGQKEDGEVIDGSLLKTSISDPNPEPVPGVSSSTPATTTVFTVATSSDLTLDLRPSIPEPLIAESDIVINTFTATTSSAE